MADAFSDTARWEQPTIAFDNQPTVVVGSNDLARELYRRDSAQTTGTRRAPWATSRAAPPARSRRSAELVCFACLLLGMAAGHLVREGRAYAAGLGDLDAVVQVTRRSAAQMPSRAARTAATVRAHDSARARTKDEAPLETLPQAARGSGRPARQGERGAAPMTGRVSAAPPSSLRSRAAMDAFFIDFEPTFRVSP